MNEAYITVEDTAGSIQMKEVPLSVIDQYDNTEIILMENYEYYFVLKVVYDDYVEIQDIVSTIGHLMTESRIDRFTVTINSSEYL